MVKDKKRTHCTYLRVFVGKDGVKSEHLGSGDPDPPVLGRLGAAKRGVEQGDLLPALVHAEEGRAVLSSLSVTGQPQHDPHLEPQSSLCYTGCLETADDSLASG